MSRSHTCLSTLPSATVGSSSRPAAALHSVAAAAATYLRRFYLSRSLHEYDPRLVAPACLYLACKTEESQVPARVLHQFCKRLSASGAILPTAAGLAAVISAACERSL